MLPDASPSGYDFTCLSVEPAGRVRVRRTARMPALVEPDAMPDVTVSSAESLVPVTSIPGVVDVAAYAAVGMTGARRESLVRTGVADALGSVARMVARDGFTLAVYDAWRPLAVQQHLFDVAYADPDLPPGFVSAPSTNPLTPPPHLTGGAVDVTLVRDGHPLELGTAFDDFTHRAHAAALEDTLHTARDLRRILFWSMKAAGFVVISCEWWHFELGTRRWAAITGAQPYYGAAAPTL